MRTELTEQVFRYQSVYLSKTKTDKRTSIRLYRTIENRCLVLLYQYPVKTHLLREEDASELLFSMRPRLPNIIASFTYTGMSFENYIQRIAYMQAHVHIRREKRKIMREMCMSIPSETMDEIVASDYSIGYGTHAIDNQKKSSAWEASSQACLELKKRIKKSKSFRRKFLQLVLLCADCLNANHIAFLASFLDMDELRLARIMHKAREHAVERCRRIEQIKQIRDRHFIESIHYQREYLSLQEISAPQEKINKLLKQYERERSLCNQRNSQIQQRTNPITHEIVAELTHVPKGTVDSGVVSLKRYLQEIMDGSG